ncbi:MAG: hypothetical protein GY767_16235 [Shimia sp.]|nr:hypothetical protein [Shimia sp.]MCP4823357.1 hypothetical protein [Shimia sp.]
MAPLISGLEKSGVSFSANDLEGTGRAQNDEVAVGFDEMPAAFSNGKLQSRATTFRVNILNTAAHSAGLSGFEGGEHLVQPILAGGRM